MGNDQETINNQENAERVVRDLGRSAVRFFALIIGIDRYVEWSDLGGAVADAEAMQQYLIEMLGVSEDHIITLFNRRATRGAILEAFRRLRDDERINRGDPIVIYYSGHGGQVAAPPAWGLERKITAIIPHDCVKKAAGTEMPPGPLPIPNLTIATLIEEIARAKGNNITVIFDCSYSGSATALGVEAFARHKRSHVLLAACGEGELAYECRNSRRGQFTAALLERLQNCPIRDLSYAELIEGIHLKNQHPQCIGVNRHRVIFDAKVLAPSHIFHPVRVRKSGEYVIAAGLAHGVRHGAEFTLYDDKKGRLGVIPINGAFLIKDFETLVMTTPPTGVSFARLTRVGKIPLYVGYDYAALDFLRHSDGYGTDAQQFQLVEAEEEAKLEVAMEIDRVIFRTLDEKLKELGLTKLPYAATLDNMARVLASAAHYYWFLGLAEKRGPTSSEDNVSLDFCSLNIEYDEFGLPVFSEGEYIFSQTDPNSSKSDVIDFVVDPIEFYGLKITNNTSHDLFLNVFLFNSDLSIVPFYTQASSGEPEAPLRKKGGTLTVGYRNGTPPFSFKLEKKQDVDVSHLKIFFATRPIDLSAIGRRSPFPKEDAREYEGGHGEVSVPLEVPPPIRSFKRGRGAVCELWFTVDIPAVQRRRKAVV